MSNDAVVGVDVGSGASRAIALDRDGRVVAIAEAAHADPGLPVGEGDPEVWRHGLIAAVSALGVSPAAFGIGGHGPTTVATSGAGAITFRHTPSASGGLALQPLAQARLLEERHGAGGAPRQLWDWMITRLGGHPGFQSVWPGQQPLVGFGDPIAVGTVAGTTSAVGGLPSGIPLVPGCHDALLTAWSSGIDTAGKGFDPGGATGGLGVAVMAPPRDPELARAALPAAVRGLVIVGGPVAAHGSMMAWWEQVTDTDMDKLIAAAAAVPPGSHGVMVLPFFEGERAPRWNPDLRAAILGLHLDHGAEVITRALLEAAAFGLAHIARNLASRGVGLNRVVASGRPARTPLLNAIKAAVLEVPLDIPDCEQMAAYGAALAAGAGIGWWPRPGEGGPGSWPIPAMTSVEPEPLPVYREAVDRFIALGDAAEARLHH